jgi:hypothetical protein
MWIYELTKFFPGCFDLLSGLVNVSLRAIWV